MPGEREPDRDRLIAAAAQVRAVLDGTRSDRLRRLFDFLLERSLEGESPSEQQIATEAFSGDGSMESGSEANVRVYIHRLRKVLDAAFSGTQGPKLHVPIGEYRIRLVDEPKSVLLSDGPATTSSMPERLRPVSIRVVAIVVAVLTIIGFASIWSDHDGPSLEEALPWETIAHNTRPVTVVVGDYYLFARLDDGSAAKNQPPQLILDRSVPTREDLTILQMLEPDRENTVVDYNQQFVSGGTIEALSTVRASFAQLPKLLHRSVKLVAASQLTPEMLGSSDIIYVGQFSGMTPLLRDPLAQASGFRFDSGFGGLADAKSAARYQSDGMTLTDQRIARRDFAYLANVPGPAGNRILVIAGVGDAGVKEAARIAGNPEQLNRLGRGTQQSRDGFEVLYRVRTIKSVNVGSVLVVDRPLRSRGIWDSSDNVPAYRPIEIETHAPTQP